MTAQVATCTVQSILFVKLWGFAFTRSNVRGIQLSCVLLTMRPNPMYHAEHMRYCLEVRQESGVSSNLREDVADQKEGKVKDLHCIVCAAPGYAKPLAGRPGTNTAQAARMA